MNLQVNQKYTEKKSFSKDEIISFANLIGDFNPLHIDEAYAKQTQFGGTIVHGMLAASYFSKIVGMDFPGSGTIYLGQNLTFKSPIRPNDTLTYEITVVNVRDDKPIVKLQTICYDSNGTIVIEGEAVVKISRSPK